MARDWRSLKEEEWKERLTPEQYEVTRCCGTEPPFTGEYWDTKDPGTYHMRLLRNTAVSFRN